MNLSHQQKQDLSHDGFTILPGLIPAPLLEAALRAINSSLGDGVPREQMETFRAQSFCPELCTAPVITDLFSESPLHQLASAALGNIVPVTYGQVALRFPTMLESDEPMYPHIDGIHTPDNGVAFGSVHNFTALAGIYLSDLPNEGMGNFTVWPGTHRLHEQYFRQHGSEILFSQVPDIELPPPRQLCGRAGDAFLCHYALGHSMSPNLSPHIRYAVFFRLKHSDHDSHSLDTLTDIWLDWHGMQGFSSGNQAS